MIPYTFYNSHPYLPEIRTDSRTDGIRSNMCLVAQLCLTLCDPWTVDCQAPLYMEFFRQEHWSGLSFSSPGDLPNPGIELGSPTLKVDSSPSELPGKAIRCNVIGKLVVRFLS